MSRKSLIICLATLAAMLVALGVAIAFLYSGTGSSQRSRRVSLDDKFICFQAVPSDAALVAGFSHAGGAVSGTLGTVAAGVSLLRGVFGGSGIILIALLLLPTLVQLLLLRTTLLLAADLGSLLSCDGEAKLLNEMASLHGYLAAAVSVCSVTFILGLTVLVKTAAAIG